MGAQLYPDQMANDLEEFLSDLSSAARACVQAPMLPLISVVLILPAQLLPLFPRRHITAWVVVTELLLLAFGLFSVGWLGVQRIWFRRIFEGGHVTASEVWHQSWGFFHRYLILGLTVGAPYLLVIVWLIVPAGSAAYAHHGLPSWWVPFWLAYAFLLDIVLTFVMPALAFATRRVREALEDRDRDDRQHVAEVGTLHNCSPDHLARFGDVEPNSPSRLCSDTVRGRL